MNGYQPISSSAVPAWLLVAAERAAREGAGLLGLGFVDIRWWKAEPWVDSYGWTNLDDWRVINLVANNLDSRIVRAVVFHEIRHTWQGKFSRYLGRQEGERDAITWSYQRTGILYSIRGEWET